MIALSVSAWRLSRSRFQAVTLCFNHTTVMFCEKLLDAADGGASWLAQLRAASLRVRVHSGCRSATWLATTWLATTSLG